MVTTDLPERKSDFRTGAKAAIGVTIPVSILAAALLTSLFFRRRKKRFGEDPTTREYRKPELEASNSKRNQGHGAARAELSTVEGAKELGKGIPHELAVPLVAHELDVTIHDSGKDNAGA